jgi:hypothetical protein
MGLQKPYTFIRLISFKISELADFFKTVASKADHKFKKDCHVLAFEHILSVSLESGDPSGSVVSHR